MNGTTCTSDSFDDGEETVSAIQDLVEEIDCATQDVIRGYDINLHEMLLCD